jgi:SAM-dependent methyltransferase
VAINQAQLVDLLTEYRRQNWAGIQTPDWQRKIVQSIAEYQAPAILKRIAPFWNLPPDPIILDLGSGVGNFVVACRNRGLRAFGVEPDRIGQSSRLTSLQIAGKRLNQAAFAAAVGEQLPFRDNTFDLVVLDQVLEHVADQKRVLTEAMRVLKPSGAMYVACPNYLRFYEPHYKLWFFPLLPKILGVMYLRMSGRDPVLLKQITYTTNWRVRNLLGTCGVDRVLDLNPESFRVKCNSRDKSAGWKRRLISRLAESRTFAKPVLRMAEFYIRLREGGCEMLAFKTARNRM